VVVGGQYVVGSQDIRFAALPFVYIIFSHQNPPVYLPQFTLLAQANQGQIRFLL